jgi:hypothetical protein
MVWLATQGLVSVVDDSRPDHLDLISFAKAQFLVAKKSSGSNVNLQGAFLRFHQEVSPFVAVDRAVKLLYVLYDAL